MAAITQPGSRHGAANEAPAAHVMSDHTVTPITWVPSMIRKG